MNRRHGAHLLLASACLLLLKLTGCPTLQRLPDPTPATPASGHSGMPPPSNSLPPEPPPPLGVPSRSQCPLAAAGRTCYLHQTDDGSPPPTPHPCQYPQIGECDPSGQPMCLFRWKPDGEACNNGLGVCQNRRCRCHNERSCGYDCTQTC
ncbi:MAG: hypothetical protein RMK29_02190 [Myxococcales bacterium]|nr:hypothetical protein [Myxococcota bacterium]MDW8280490.1 hypothetical protein [Myxococcales bacterium]